MYKPLFTLLLSLLVLTACDPKVWDPTLRIDTTSGHVLGKDEHPGPRTTAPEEIPPREEEVARPAAKAELYPGSGRFVRVGKTAAAPQGGGDITLNFDNADLREVVKVILGDLLKVNYVLDPHVKGGVTLQTAEPLRKDLLIPTLETLLRMNGAALVRSGGLYRVVPLDSAIRGSIAPQLGDSHLPLPRGYGVRVVPLKYIAASEMAKILKPLAPEGSVVRVDSVRNLIVLAGTSPELANLLDTVSVFDVDWIKGLSVGFFRLEYTKVQDVAKQLRTLLGNKGENPLADLIRVVPVESANALLVITPQAKYLDEVRKWIARLDQAGDEGDASDRLYVYRVKNGDAENLANILNKLFSEEGGAKAAPPASIAPGQRAANIATKPKSPKGKAKAAKPLARPARANTAVRIGANVHVVADTVNNSLLVRASPRDYRRILEALKKLDIMPLQVLVEATIVEVSLSGELKYGLQWFLQAHHGNGTTSNIKWDGTLNDSKQSGLGDLFPGFNWSVVNGVGDIRAVLSAFAGDGLVKVLSSPSVMVLDNHTAKIQVGDQVPVATSQQQGTATTDRVINTIEYKDTGVMLSVTPRVTPGGLVIMDIVQEVSDVTTTKTSSLDSPTIQTRNIDSSVAVKSGQPVVLGGLIRNQSSNNSSGLPGLHDVPGIGWLFGQKSKSSSRTELVVVLTPRVIAGEKDVKAVTEDFRTRMQGLKGGF